MVILRSYVSLPVYQRVIQHDWNMLEYHPPRNFLYIMVGGNPPEQLPK